MKKINTKTYKLANVFLNTITRHDRPLPLQHDASPWTSVYDPFRTTTTHIPDTTTTPQTEYQAPTTTHKMHKNEILPFGGCIRDILYHFYN